MKHVITLGSGKQVIAVKVTFPSGSGFSTEINTTNRVALKLVSSDGESLTTEINTDRAATGSYLGQTFNLE